MHVLRNTRAATHNDEQGTAKQPRSGRDRPWAAKQQAARLIWPGDFMYNFKYYSLLALYYAATLVRGLLLVLLTPVNFTVEALYSIVSDWEPSKPLHKSNPDDDIDYDKHLGIWLTAISILAGGTLNTLPWDTHTTYRMTLVTLY